MAVVACRWERVDRGSGLSWSKSSRSEVPGTIYSGWNGGSVVFVQLTGSVGETHLWRAKLQTIEMHYCSFPVTRQ